MQASWSTDMTREESSCPRGETRLLKRGVTMPSAAAWVSSSQSPLTFWRTHGLGWSDMSSSSTMRRCLRTLSEAVYTFMPFSAGRTQEGLEDFVAAIDRTDAADADRTLILGVAENRNGNSVHARGIEYGRSFFDRLRPFRLL